MHRPRRWDMDTPAGRGWAWVSVAVVGVGVGMRAGGEWRGAVTRYFIGASVGEVMACAQLQAGTGLSLGLRERRSGRGGRRAS
jgi:hypothetical protein